jgi:cation transport ATPase
MNHQETKQKEEMEQMEMKHNMYRKLALMSFLSFVAMYFLMFSMINTIGNFTNNINMAYMAGLMVAPMVVFELIVMWSMYKDKKRNYMVIAGAIVAGILLFLFIRQQAIVGDRQFLRSMIPHHSGAILMCQQSSINDQEIQELCQEIIESQQQEIDQMKEIMERLE